MATCQQPGSKYDLEKVRDRTNEPLRAYIHHFFETRISIPKISEADAIESFVKGLCFHDDLHNKLLCKKPEMVQDLFTVAKKWADADEAN